MSRAFWFVAGAGAGVYVVTRARRVAEAFTPEGLADRLAGLAVGARLFGDEVRAGAAEKENEVRERVGLAFHGTSPDVPELTTASGGAEAVQQTDSPPPTREGND